MENVKQGTEKMKSDFKNVLEQIQDTDNIDDFHSVGIGRFKITQVNGSKRFAYPLLSLKMCQFTGWLDLR